MKILWNYLKVEDITIKVGMGPFGSSIKVDTFTEKGVPIISGQHLHKFRLDESAPFNFISEEHAKKLSSANVFPGDVIFTHAGNIQNVAYIPENCKYEKYVVSQRQFYLRCNTEKILPSFITYYFKTSEGLSKLLSNSSSVGVPSIAQPVSNLRKITVPVPPLPVQRIIVETLGMLEDKLELNYQTNAILEDIAQAIFKEWFVDFNYPTATGELVESELGLIPKGWRVAKLGEILDVKGGTTPSTTVEEYWNGEHAFVTPKDLSSLDSPFLLTTERKITQKGVQQISSGILPSGILLLSSRAPIGYLAITDIPVSINQGFIAINAKETSNLFILLWLKNNIETVNSRANGSTFLEISKSNFREIELIIPDTQTANNFNNLISPIYELIKLNAQKSSALASLRDTLLPKLMSGEIYERG